MSKLRTIHMSQLNLIRLIFFGKIIPKSGLSCSTAMLSQSVPCENVRVYPHRARARNEKGFARRETILGLFIQSEMRFTNNYETFLVLKGPRSLHVNEPFFVVCKLHLVCHFLLLAGSPTHSRELKSLLAWSE